VRPFASKAFVLLLVRWLPLAASAQSPSPNANITSFFIDKAEPGSGYETGPLHILYSDGTRVIQRLSPLKKSTDKETAFNQVGVSEVQLGDDKKTLGWAVQVENCCTSYSIPLTVAVFRAGEVLHSFNQQVVWRWMFLRGSKQLAIVWGPTHGTEVGDYRLYDIATGKVLSEVWGDEETQSLKENAPHWARELEQRLHQP
jgi:hypothetical protein